MIDWTKIKHFKRTEFKDPEKISPVLVWQLDRVRVLAKVRMTITSSYRPGPRFWITRAGKRKSSAHRVDNKGIYHGVDVRTASSKARMKIIAAALEAGFVRIGVYDHHVHLDVARKGFAQGVMWWEKST